MREHVKRKGRNLLGRSTVTGRLRSEQSLHRNPTEASQAERKRRAELEAAREELRQEEWRKSEERGAAERARRVAVAKGAAA